MQTIYARLKFWFLAPALKAKVIGNIDRYVPVGISIVSQRPHRSSLMVKMSHSPFDPVGTRDSERVPAPPSAAAVEPKVVTWVKFPGALLPTNVSRRE